MVEPNLNSSGVFRTNHTPLRLLAPFNDPSSSDFKVEVHDAQVMGIIHLHKIFLWRSTYFRAILKNDLVAKHNGTIILKHTSLEFMKILLESLYMEEIDITNWSIQDLLSLYITADRYQFEPVIEALQKPIQEAFKQEIGNKSWPNVISDWRIGIRNFLGR